MSACSTTVMRCGRKSNVWMLKEQEKEPSVGAEACRAVAGQGAGVAAAGDPAARAYGLSEEDAEARARAALEGPGSS